MRVEEGGGEKLTPKEPASLKPLEVQQPEKLRRVSVARLPTQTYLIH